MDVSAAVLPIHLLVIRSARGLGVLFDGNISGFGVNIFTGAFTIATIASVTALNTVAPVSCATDVGTNDVIDMLPITVIGVVSGSDVDMLAGVVANNQLKSPTALVSKEGTLGFNGDACSCWPTTM